MLTYKSQPDAMSLSRLLYVDMELLLWLSSNSNTHEFSTQNLKPVTASLAVT
jgi:hypothetical protein